MTDDVAAFLDAVETEIALAKSECILPSQSQQKQSAIYNRRHRLATGEAPVLVAGWRRVLALCDADNADDGYLPERIRAALVEALSPTPTPTAEETKNVTETIKCDGCGKDSGQATKPPKWYQRGDGDGVQNACSRECIDRIAAAGTQKSKRSAPDGD